MKEKIDLEEKVCMNCEHMIWMVGIGFGVRCGHPKRRQYGNNVPLIPSRTYTCDKFDYKKELRKNYE
tara:strand:+ start:173 stop:373 length:201 start_codon:yes stop_codon:yes gene_type:complete